MREQDWNVLVDKLRRGQCTPFLGAGISEPHIPSGGAVARQLAEEFRYPLTDPWNLPRVAQYVATSHGDAQFVKGRVADVVRAAEEANAPDFSDPSQPHRVLAEFRLPLYLTTNYDRFMTKALTQVVGDTVTTLVCPWNYNVRQLDLQRLEHEPTGVRPVVFHLHGVADQLPSILLTEDDYIDFITEAQGELSFVIPPIIQRALSTYSLLFVGYSLNDWNFRILLRSIMRRINKSGQRLNMSVQLPPGDSSVAPGAHQEAEAFLCDYLGTEDVRVHWGDAREFLNELRQRWDATRERAGV